MHFRQSSLLDDFRAFDEPSDWSPSPELNLVLRRRRSEEPTFRALLSDPEAGWASWAWERT
jgi:hypothetical protein